MRRRLEQGNVLLDVYETFSDTIEMGRGNKVYIVKSISESVHLLKYDNKRIVSLHKIYLIVVKMHLQRNNDSPVKIDFHEMIKKLNMEKEYERLCMTIDFFVSDNWRSIVSKYVEERLDTVGYKDPNRARIIDFINQNAKYPISKENIEICYNNFEKEIILLFQKSVQKKMESEIRKVINIWLPTNINR